MDEVTRRRVLAGGLGTAAAAALAACGVDIGGGAVPSTPGATGTGGTPPPTTSASPSTTGTTPGPTTSATGIPNDGSWQDTGPQPKQPTPRVLQAGDTPPQLVVVSWDGAGESERLPLLSHFRSVAAELGASMTFFLSGLYTLPASKRTMYAPPQHPVGASAIPFLSDSSVHATIKNIGEAWLDGHEIGTHFNGHFCGDGGVGAWSPDDWHSEIQQAMSFVMGWRTNTGFTDLPPLPFDYRKELIGARTPCLEGSANLRQTAAALGWRYDSSATGTQVWPRKVGPLWAVDLQSIPFVGHQGSVLSMDYNMMFNQSKIPNGDPNQRAKWQQEAVDSYLAGFKRAYDGNRAPMVIGNHFEGWNGGIYMTAVEQVMRTIATYPDAKIISFRQLCAYLDAQRPAVLDRLRSLPIGAAPSGGWKSFLPSA